VRKSLIDQQIKKPVSASNCLDNPDNKNNETCSMAGVYKLALIKKHLLEALVTTSAPNSFKSKDIIILALWMCSLFVRAILNAFSM
jgi:hypothetical protein